MALGEESADTEYDTESESDVEFVLGCQSPPPFFSPASTGGFSSPGLVCDQGWYRTQDRDGVGGDSRSGLVPSSPLSTPSTVESFVGVADAAPRCHRSEFVPAIAITEEPEELVNLHITDWTIKHDDYLLPRKMSPPTRPTSAPPCVRSTRKCI